MADFRKSNVVGSRHTCHHLRRAERQAEAIERTKDRARRTAEEQLALITTRPGTSAREIARLTA